MAAITNPETKVTAFSGEYKALSLNGLVPTTASDAITLSFADNRISEIQNVLASLSAGQDANLANVIPSHSGLVVTLTTIGADGSAATDWTGAKVNLLVIGK